MTCNLANGLLDLPYSSAALKEDCLCVSQSDVSQRTQKWAWSEGNAAIVTEGRSFQTSNRWSLLHDLRHWVR